MAACFLLSNKDDKREMDSPKGEIARAFFSGRTWEAGGGVFRIETKDTRGETQPAKPFSPTPLLEAPDPPSNIGDWQSSWGKSRY